jgi:thymidylate kinase
VLFDRYPLPEARFDGRYVDGPRIAALASARPSRLLSVLGVMEARLYRRLPTIDRIILLDVEPERALARRASRQPELLTRKVDALRRASSARSHGRVVVLDANQTLAEVELDARRAVWDAL